MKSTITGTGNIATWCPLIPNSHDDFTEGNLFITPDNDSQYACTHAFDITGSTLYYWEVDIIAQLSGSQLEAYIGILGATSVGGFPFGKNDGNNPSDFQYIWASTGRVRDTGTVYATFDHKDTVMFCAGDGKLWYGVNGTWANSGNPNSGSGNVVGSLTGSWVPAYQSPSGTYSSIRANFGQKPFKYGLTGNASNAVILSTANLPEPTVTDPRKYFGTITHTGNTSSYPHDVTDSSINFTPDFGWSTSRAGSENRQIIDIVGGVDNYLISDDTTAYNTGSNITFIENGYRVASGGNDRWNKNGVAIVTWLMKAGGSGSANTDGSTNYNSTVSVADHSGFSIVKWTSHSSVSSGTKVGHGMGKKPEIIIIKSTTQADNWHFWHKDLSGTGKYLKLNLDHGEADDSGNAWDGHANTNTSTFSVGDGGGSSWTNDANTSYMAYCFARTPGLIGIGKYTGNNSTDGTNVIIDDGASGFKPAWVIIKRNADGYSWHIHNSAMAPYNPAAGGMNANDTGSESATGYLDFTSNGFKLRTTNGGYNGSATYIYLAFAERPFGLNNRAR
jgi:hypothetical protein